MVQKVQKIHFRDTLMKIKKSLVRHGLVQLLQPILTYFSLLCNFMHITQFRFHFFSFLYSFLFPLYVIFITFEKLTCVNILLQVHKKDKKYKCMVCKKIFMLAASVGIRHGSRRYGVCVDCADSHQATQEGLEGMQELEFARDDDFEETAEGDEDMVEEADGEEPNEIDQSNWEGDTGATPEED